MFTGIIKILGRINYISRNKIVIALQNDITQQPFKISESIAINGICFTIVKIDYLNENVLLSFDIAEETFRKTNISKLKIGEVVNIERPLKAGDEFGGHFVLGHIDSQAKIIKIKPGSNSFLYYFKIQDSYSKFLIPKGSIAIDGISLTIVDVLKDVFTVAIIPHTKKNTNLKFKRVGDTVNVEIDMFAKYLNKILENYTKIYPKK